uniref:Uncharacterized protein n=1 Tax=Candidatus Kentrum sp. FM TaxID=2126340 RepID=A0A450SJE6_9GAMM|nr:MAG: hypothetical protein BECKFM1743A_GA0114220_101165 [Candidatus Kentron sp. FM]VFJ53842.1 MAG: hypothetical protein BECKFM1743C_GA0114222_101304 [Candidatus Kentron sp. FM]VFK07310.1 MAG: hypothetical protein BECKFM1743B_GA0114221_100374 [Candidatus Kentron sp. FM]
MYEDEIILEVWRNRDNYVAQHHYSLDEIVADLQARRKEITDILSGETGVTGGGIAQSPKEIQTHQDR